MTQKQHAQLNILLILIFTITGTFFFSSSFNEVGWYMALYFIASYFRLYPNKYTESVRINLIMLLSTVILAYSSVLAFDFIGYSGTYYFVADSHKIFPLVIGVSTFLLFKNLKIRNNYIINAIASTTFGVLLIHANSDAMRTFLWQDLLKVPSMYNANLSSLIIHAVLCMLGVFIVCSMIDMIRIYLLEKPFMKWLDKKFPILSQPI